MFDLIACCYLNTLILSSKLFSIVDIHISDSEEFYRATHNAHQRKHLIQVLLFFTKIQM